MSMLTDWPGEGVNCAGAAAADREVWNQGGRNEPSDKVLTCWRLLRASRGAMQKKQNNNNPKNN